LVDMVNYASAPRRPEDGTSKSNCYGETERQRDRGKKDKRQREERRERDRLK
jgi:hypothetical protein